MYQSPSGGTQKQSKVLTVVEAIHMTPAVGQPHERIAEEEEDHHQDGDAKLHARAHDRGQPAECVSAQVRRARKEGAGRDVQGVCRGVEGVLTGASDQQQSAAISGNQWQSVAISGRCLDGGL